MHKYVSVDWSEIVRRADELVNHPPYGAMRGSGQQFRGEFCFIEKQTSQ